MHQNSSQGNDKAREVKKELQKQQRIFQQLEEKIAKLKEQKMILESALAAPETYSNKEIFLKTETDYKTISSELEQLNKKYEEVFERIVELE